MSDRDLLEDLLLAAKIDAKTPDETADDIERAGWRPPAQVIETTSQVDALPDGAVIRDAEGSVFEVVVSENGVAFRTTRPWTGMGADFGYGSVHVSLPAVVLFLPTENGDTK
jgi:hypothetical protein